MSDQGQVCSGKVKVRSRSGKNQGRAGQSHVMIRSDQVMVWSGKVRSVTVEVKSRLDKGQVKVRLV